MSYIGQGLPADVFGGYTTDSFTGDGSATTFTLSQEPISEQGLLVVINNVIQQPTTNYTVSGTTLTIVGTAVASGDVIYARHTGVALPIGTASVLDKITTIGSGAAEDTKIVFDGNAQDFYIGLDDSDYDLIIGLGSTVGTTPIISVDENKDVAIPDGGLTITVDDNSDNLTLTSTDADANAGPNMLLDRNSSSTANQDILGTITFRGRNDAGQNVDYIKLESRIADETDGTEDGNFDIYNITAGTARKYISVNRADITINEDSQDIDFRVESNGDDSCLFVNAGDDKVQIGGNASSDANDTRIDLFNFGQLNFFRNASSDVFTIIFNNTNSGNVSGSIRQNGDATAFNTSSDYRLKENVDYTWDATTRLKQLKPAKFNWISDDTNTLLEGFLAHEVSSIVPQAVSGEKDEVATADDVAAGIASSVGDAIHQGIDQSKLVPLLVKTVQELEARIAALEG